MIYLLANGTGINEKYQKDESYDGEELKNSTPLHFSSRYGHLSVVEYLVIQKADINSKNKAGKTLLGLASEKGKSDVVEFLKSKGGK